MKKKNEYIDLYCCWFKMGLFTFGGGYAMLPMIEEEIINRRHWATQEEIMDYYAIGQCTPGIIAVNTATFVGYYRKGIIGGIIATLGVVSPSLIIITLIAGVLTNFQNIPTVQHALAGIRVSVCVLMSVSILKLFKSNITGWITGILFALAFGMAYFTNISTVYLIVISALAGILLTSIHAIGMEDKL